VLRLEDILVIVLALIGTGATILIGGALIALWPRPWSDLWLLARALWRRYVVFEWPDVLDRLADDRIDAEIGADLVDMRADTMSSWGAKTGSGPVPLAPRSSSGDSETPHQNQGEPSAEQHFQYVISVLTEQPLTDAQAIAILAVMHRENDEHFASANKIRDLVGGADAVVKSQVAARRSRKPAIPRRLTRPTNGW
jgi:hypothetical protein